MKMRGTAAEVLVLADLRGVESHGGRRLRRYYQGCWTHYGSRPEIRADPGDSCNGAAGRRGSLGQVAGSRE